MGQEAGADTYDVLHSQAESSVPVRQSYYLPLYRRVVEEVTERSVKSVLEVGCGTGGLAELLMTTPAEYRGFDFSSVGVQRAGKRTGRPEAFFIGNALDTASYRFPYEAIVCTEVLEHITRDLDVVSLWKPGTWCICSVPNFDYSTHVRFFRREEEVRARYGALIDIETVVRVAKPPFTGNTLREYLRRVRWAREEPKKMLGLLGVNTFDWYAGWFMFAGRRKG
jgi:2-polyprenyl-3-methyl-5-hydroxy-6-metoxy-1,4-benzoquinol methylase